MKSTIKLAVLALLAVSTTAHSSCSKDEEAGPSIDVATGSFKGTLKSRLPGKAFNTTANAIVTVSKQNGSEMKITMPFPEGAYTRVIKVASLDGDIMSEDPQDPAGIFIYYTATSQLSISSQPLAADAVQFSFQGPKQ
ncbi:MULTISPECIES: hypothetical protein [Sphingobacterium]|uniref:hypothetical protein n=1 Tax=Sphingobacterium TaxID=28453 RepID=UPI0011F279AF|nr:MULTISPECIES: hypothetical protein [Sphingobacterium]